MTPFIQKIESEPTTPSPDAQKEGLQGEYMVTGPETSSLAQQTKLGEALSYKAQYSYSYDRIWKGKELCKELILVIKEALELLEDQENLDGILAEMVHRIDKIYDYAEKSDERPIRRVMVLLEGALKFFPAEQLTKEILLQLKETVQFFSIYWPCKDSDVAELALDLEESGLNANKPFTAHPNQPENIIIKKSDGNIEIVEC